ncbi:BON domain-containing protein [Thiovibrio frasassiensis]|uniref:Osmotically-inducible protein Y n=1 Tax=Thiovibrio frasassiensis TaxID=2984131 RepID=A0A9X4MPG3_9BACT|nr:BON domain-containing protein [Thiovibrio frasassiensis]MDG4476492.1 BON domain-containing protein [Thiovibrio frasassiensis]
MKTLNFFVGMACYGCVLVSFGCSAAVVGGTAAGGYAVGSDERSTGTMVDDGAITAKVKTELIGDKNVKARNIDVDTVSGVVVLSGYVDSQHESNRAAFLAKSVSGVVRVRNELQVGSRTLGQGFDDKVLGAKIKARLVEEPGVRSFNVDVDVYSGSVSVTGTVPSQEQKRKVLNLIRSVEGVKGVVDNLQVH